MLLTEQQVCQDNSDCIYYEHLHPDQSFEEMLEEVENMPLDDEEDEDNQPQPW
jgi:hypothetical protein